jgi:type I restriction enzyme S subunit
MNGELPRGWVEYDLQDCVDVLDSQRVPVNSDERSARQGKVPYYGATGQVGWIDSFLFDEELLLIGEDGAPFFVKAKPIAYIIRGKSWVNNHAHVLRAKNGVTSNHYLKYFLDWFPFDGYVNGTTRLKLTQGAMNSIPVRLAPPAEQRRIVAKLEQILERVDSSQKRLDRISSIIKRFRQSVLAAAYSGRLTEDWKETDTGSESATDFLKRIADHRKQKWETKRGDVVGRKYPEPDAMDSSDLPDIPESWQWAAGDAICSQITDGEHIQPPYQSEGHPMLSAKHVRDGFVTLEGAGLISEQAFRKALERCKPVNGDILIVSVGATTGRSAIVDKCPPFAIVRSVLLLKPLIPERFLLRWLQTSWCFRWMTQASGASAQPHLYIKDTKRLPVPIPPLAEQHEIVRRVEALFKIADRIEARYQEAKKRVDGLTQSILAKAFRGELVPQDPRDEPADALLERLREEHPASNNGKPRGAIRRSRP